RSDLAGRYDAPQRSAPGIGLHVDPGGQPASGTPRRLIPAPFSRCRLLMSTHNRAVDHQILMNIRLSAPVRPGSPALPASSDAILSHCPSLSSYRFASTDRPPCSTRRPVKHSSADL